MYGQEPQRKSLDDLWTSMEQEAESQAKPKPRPKTAAPRKSLNSLLWDTQYYGPPVPPEMLPKPTTPVAAPKAKKTPTAQMEPYGPPIPPEILPSPRVTTSKPTAGPKPKPSQTDDAVAAIEEINRRKKIAEDLFKNADAMRGKPGFEAAIKTTEEQADRELAAANEYAQQAARKFKTIEVGFGRDANPNSPRRWVYAKPKDAAVEAAYQPIVKARDRAGRVESYRKDYESSNPLSQYLQRLSTQYLSDRADNAPGEQEELDVRREAMGMAPRTKEQPGVLTDLVSRTARGAIGLIPTAVTGVAGAADAMYNRLNRATGNQMPKGGDWLPYAEQFEKQVNEGIAPIAPIDPARNEDFTSKLASGFGSAAGFGAAGAATQALKMPARYGVGLLGTGAGAGEMIQQAREAGFNPEDDPARWERMIALGGASGLTEIFGFGKMLDEFGLKRQFVKRAIDVLEEGGQEALQQFLGNVNAAYVGQFDKNRPLGKDVLENAIIGGIIGGTMQTADATATRLQDIAAIQATRREPQRPLNLTPSAAPGTQTQRVTVPPSFVRKVSEQPMVSQPSPAQEVVLPTEPLASPVAPAPASSPASPTLTQPIALLFPDAQPIAPIPNLETLSPQDRAAAMLDQIRQQRQGRANTGLEQQLNTEFAEGAGLVNSAAQSWDTDRPTAEMLATTGAQRLKAALQNLQKSEAYQMELGAVASGTAQPGPYIAAAQSIQQQLDQADGLFRLDAERERQQAELAREQEKQQKKADKEAAKQAKFAEREQQKLARQLQIENQRAQTQAKRDEAAAKRMETARAAQEARRAQLEQQREQSRNEKTRKVAETELQRIRLHDAALEAADTAGQRHQEYLNQGMIAEAINELAVQQKQLRDAVRQLPRTPQAQAIKADLERYQGQIGNRIGDLRKQMRGQRVPVTQAIPPLFRADAAQNPEGGVPELPSFYEPGAVFDREVDAIGDTEIETSSLLATIRRLGGIRADGISDGELERLGVRESGTTGLVNNRGGLSPDRMREALAEEGLLPSDSTVDDLFQAIEGEMRGGRRAQTRESIADFYDRWEAETADAETEGRGDREIQESAQDEETEDMAALQRSIARSRADNPRPYDERTRPGEPGSGLVSFSQYAELERRNVEPEKALYNNEPTSETFKDAVEWITEDAAKAGIGKQHADAMVAYALNWHSEKAFWESRGLSMDTVQGAIQSVDEKRAEVLADARRLPPLERTQIEREVAALDALFDDPDAVNLLERAAQGEDNAADEFNQVADEYGISTETAGELIRARRPVRRANPASQNTAPARPGSDSPKGQTETGREPGRSAKNLQPLYDLLRQNPATIPDVQFDSFLTSLENWRNEGIYGSDFGGVDLPPSLEQDLRRKLAATNEERRSRVKVKRLPAKHAPLPIPTPEQRAERQRLVEATRDLPPEEQQRQIAELRRRQRESGESGRALGKEELADAMRGQQSEARTVTHPDPTIDGKPVLAETSDGRVIVPNPENKSGISVVKDRIEAPTIQGNQSFSDMAERENTAAQNMIETIMTLGEMSREDAWRVFEIYQKRKLFDTKDVFNVGQLRVKSGNLLDRETLREAAGLTETEKTSPQSKRGRLALAVADHLTAGNKFANIIEARKFIAQQTGEQVKPGSLDAKQVDEAIEAGAVMAARRIVAEGKSPQETFRALLGLQDRLPTLSARTSTSVLQQAYSTPLPLAYVASRLAGIDSQTTVYEPSAGHSALLIAASPTKIVANELNEERAAALRDILPGAEITEHDAADWKPAQRVDRVITNPPFGAVKDDFGKNRRFQIDGKYETSEIDHAIAFEALKAMKDDGKAVLIVAGLRSDVEAARSAAYNTGAKRNFYFTLYNQYNVVDHFTVNGDLYNKQGAGWPVDIIVIDGRGKSQRDLPAVAVPQILNTWEAVGAKLDATGARRPTEESRTADDVRLGERGLSDSQRDSRAGERAVDDERVSGVSARSSEGNARPGRPADVGAPVADRPTGNRRTAEPASEPARPGRSPEQSDFQQSSSARASEQPRSVSGARNHQQGQPAREATRQGNQPGTVDQRTDRGAGRTSDVNAILDEEFEKLFGENAPSQTKPTESKLNKTTSDVRETAQTSSSPVRVNARSVINAIISLDEAVRKRRTGAGGHSLTPEQVDERKRDLEHRKRELHEMAASSLEARAQIEAEIDKIGNLQTKRLLQDALQSPSPKKQPRPTKEVAKSAVKETASGLDNIAKGFAELFDDPNRLGSGPVFDEQTYAKAKPYFEAAVEHFKNATTDVREVIRRLLTELKNTYNFAAETVQKMKPYIVRFVEDFQARQAQAAQAQTAATVKPVTTQTKTAEADSDTHRVYKPASGSYSVGTLVPINMANAVENSLNRLKEEVGDLDTYVADRLGYKPDELSEYFSGEQVDAVALAVRNIENGGALILGDQTGIGKGRVVAGVIRYAIKQKLTPVFVTEKPTLYGDMIRDLADIGSANVKPLITNAGESVPLDDDALAWYGEAEKAKLEDRPVPAKRGKFLQTKAGKEHNSMLKRFSETGNLGGHHVIFTTYNQMQTVKGKRTDRHDLLERFARGGIVIFDESHNAGGAGKVETDDKGEVKFDRATFARQLARDAKGLLYSSATFAKRPEVMDLYFRTELGKAVSDLTELSEITSKGGVPMQQVIASMLAESGQYIRRERSFAGVEYAPTPTKVDRKTAENVSRAMREVAQFDLVKQEAVKTLAERVKKEAKRITGDGTVGQAGVHSVNFTSLMHNLIDQSLLALKVDQAADMAIAALERGEKPVITVANTMGSFIQRFAEENELRPGAPITLSFNDLLDRYLERSREVIVGKPYGEKFRHYLSDEELGDEGVAAYDQAKQFLESLKLDIPISPIDWLHKRLRDAGYRTGEITGRGHIINYTDDGPVYTTRPVSETSTAAKKRTIAAFNDGTMDVIILNQSGSTGISLHASEKFKDQRRRHMIIAQAEKNIDTHMQMLGRVHRTGQVIPPRYTQMVADIPAELRPAAVLAKKMASLNANTTASRSSAVTAKDVPDFMNKYGDDVAASLMESNPELHEMLGRPLRDSEKKEGYEREDAMRKVTGRIPLLPIAEQEAVYEQLIDEYADALQQAEASGENALEAKTLDLQAETTKTQLMVPGSGASLFEQPANLERVKANRQGKPFKSDEVIEKLQAALGNDARNLIVLGRAGAQQIRQTRGDLEAEVAAYKNKVEEEHGGTKRAAIDQLAADKWLNRWNQITGTVYPGATVQATGGYGVVLSVERKGKRSNPVALSGWRATIMMTDSRRQLQVPFSKIDLGEATEGTGRTTIRPGQDAITYDSEKEHFVTIPILDAFDKGLSATKETRYMVTGNLIAGFGAAPNGQIVNFTDDAGRVKQGILMPTRFDPADVAGKQKEKLKSVEAVLNALTDARGEVNDREGNLTIRRAIGGSGYVVSVPSAKGRGGKYYLNRALLSAAGRDFAKRGGLMEVQVGESSLRQMIDVLLKGAGMPAAVGLQAKAPKIAERREGQPKTRDDVENSPEFKRWFKGSVVTEDRKSGSRPVYVYHGTQSPVSISSLDYSKLDPNALYGPGFYTTQDPNVAASHDGGYAINKGDNPESAHAYKLYLRIQNPFDINGYYLPAKFPPKLKSALPGYVRIMSGDGVYDALVEKYGSKAEANLILQLAGFDGITHLGGVYNDRFAPKFNTFEEAKAAEKQRGGEAVARVPGDTFDKSLPAHIPQRLSDDVDRIEYTVAGHRVWIAFYPEQIKSATGNRGTFDPAAAKITERHGSAPFTERYTVRDLAANATAEYRPAANRPGTVFLNEWGHALVRDTLVTVYGEKVAGISGDFTLDTAAIRNVADEMRDRAGGVFAKFANTLETAAGDADVNGRDVAIVTKREGQSLSEIKQSVRHETVHAAQSAVDAELTGAATMEWLNRQPKARQIKAELERRGYKSSTFGFEAVAFVASGDFGVFGMSLDEATRLMDSYYQATVRKYGASALTKFGAIDPKLQPTLERARRETQFRGANPERTTQDTGRSGRRAESQIGRNRAGDGGTPSAGQRGVEGISRISEQRSIYKPAQASGKNVYDVEVSVYDFKKQENRVKSVKVAADSRPEAMQRAEEQVARSYPQFKSSGAKGIQGYAVKATSVEKDAEADRYSEAIATRQFIRQKTQQATEKINRLPFAEVEKELQSAYREAKESGESDEVLGALFEAYRAMHKPKAGNTVIRALNKSDDAVSYLEGKLGDTMRTIPSASDLQSGSEVVVTRQLVRQKTRQAAEKINRLPFAEVEKELQSAYREAKESGESDEVLGALLGAYRAMRKPKAGSTVIRALNKSDDAVSYLEGKLGDAMRTIPSMPSQSGFSLHQRRAPKTTPLREIIAEHQPLVVDPYKIQDMAMDEILNASERGIAGTLPGARALYWARKLKAKPIADKLANRQANFISDTLAKTNEIIQAHEAMRAAERGSEAYQAAKKDFYKARRELHARLQRTGEYAGPVEYLTKYLKASILTAPHILTNNVLDHLASFPFHEAQKLMGFLLPARALRRWGVDVERTHVDFRDLVPAIGREMSAIVKGTKDALPDFVHMLRYGTTDLLLDEEIARQQVAADESTGGADKYEIGKRAKGVPGLDQVITVVGRTHGAVDVMGRRWAFATAIASQADAIAKRVGKENGFTKDDIAALRDDLAAEPSPQMVVLAMEEANRFVLDYPTFIYDLIQGARKLGEKKHPVANKAFNNALDLLVKFQKIPLAAQAQSLWYYTPMGLVGQANRVRRANKANKAGKPISKQESAEIVERLQQGALGTLAWASAGLLGSLGYLTVAGGDDRERVRNAEEVMGLGYDPQLMVGNKAIELNRLGTFGRAGSVAARLTKAAQPRRDAETGDPEPESKRAKRIGKAFMKGVVLDNPVGRGLSDVFVSDTGDPFENFARGQIRSMQPGFLRNVAKVQDGTRRIPDTNDFAGKVKSDLKTGNPWLRKTLQPRLDALGNPAEEHNPFSFLRTVKDNPQLQEMIRLGTGLPKPKRDKDETAVEYNRRIAGFVDPVTGERVPGQADQTKETLRQIANDPNQAKRSDVAKARIYSKELTPSVMKRAAKLSEESVLTEREIEALRADTYEELRGLPAYREARAKEQEAIRKVVNDALDDFRARAQSTRRSKSGKVSIVREKAAQLPDIDVQTLARWALDQAGK